jgi:large subunit ribosomal protein L9
MRVLLLKDVYKLGRAGDVKRVADGYGRNFLIPQRLATLATATAIKQAESLRANAAIARAKLNAELAGVADTLNSLVLTFSVKAGDTGKLYGSITPAQIAEQIKKSAGLEIDRRNVGNQPLRELGDYKIPVRLTADLIPVVKVTLYREGEAPKPAAPAAPPAPEAEAEPELEMAAEPEMAADVPAEPEPEEASAAE